MFSNVTGSASKPDPKDEGFGLYVHWPFCVSKCPYCDFNSHVSDSVDHGRWRAALLSELNWFATRTEGRTLTSIFFGGGTPSLMAPDTVADILDAARGRWATPPDLEITLEANPGTVDRDRFRALHDAGIKRLSLGIQSLDDNALAFLGRRHSAESALNALREAASLFDAVSADFIYARPGQTLDAWRSELSTALDILNNVGGAHLSLYQLTIEQGTAFETAVARQDFTPLDDDTAADMFDMTQEVLSTAGLPAYEISNHARHGSECRHNMTYWRGGDYIGIGPGAHGRLRENGSVIATRQTRLPGKWLERAEAGGGATTTEEAVPSPERATELLLSGLRLAEGLPAGRFERLSSVALTDAVDVNAVDQLSGMGFLEFTDGVLKATAKGRPVLNRILSEIAR